MLGNFFSYLQYEKRCSAHTLEAYKRDLEQFLNYIEQQYEISDPKEVEPVMVRSWIISQMELELKPRSIHRKLAAVRSFYRFLISVGQLSRNPVAGVKKPKFDKKLPAFAPNSLLNEAIDRLSHSPDFTSLRDRILIELLYGTGIRRAELIGLNKTDYDSYRRLIRVKGKGNKERMIPIYPELQNLLEEYLQERNKVCEPTERSLVLTDQFKRCYPMFVQRKVSTFLQDMPGLSQKSPHILRHTYATHLLDSGAELQGIKELLGHASLAATQVYTHNSIEKLKKAYDQAHPKS